MNPLLAHSITLPVRQWLGPLGMILLLAFIPLPSSALMPPPDSTELKIALVGKAEAFPSIMRANHTLSPNSRNRHTNEVDAFIQSLNEAEFQSVLDSLPAMHYDFDVYYPALSVARRLAAKDPRMALDYFQRTWEDLNQQFDAYRIVMEVWYAKAPAELEHYVFQALAEWGTSEQRMASYMADVLAEKHLVDGLDKTIEWLEAITNVTVRAKAAEAVMGKMHKDCRHEDFAPWVATNASRPEFKEVVIAMAATLSSVNPLRGHEWAFGLPDSPAKYHALCSQFESLGNGHPMMGVAWFNAPDEAKESSLGRLLKPAKASSPSLGVTQAIGGPEPTSWGESFLVEDLVAAYVTGIMQIPDHTKAYFIISQVTDPIFQPLVHREYIRQYRRRDLLSATKEALELGVILK